MVKLPDETVPDQLAPAIGELVPRFGFQAVDLEPDANAAAWREAVATLFDVDELAAGEAGPFQADLVTYAMGSVVLGITRASGQRFHRSLDTVARSGIDHVIVQLYTRGGYDGVAGERPMRVRAGDVCLFDLAQTLETRATPFENLTLVAPRPKLVARFAHPEALHGLVLPRANVMAAVIGRHLQALAELAPRMTLSECEAIIEGSVDLITACLRGELDRRDAGSEGSTDVLIRIKQHVEARLGDARLSGEVIAAHFGLSRATLYRLFASYGGVATFVRGRRLHRAFFDLAAPGAVVRDVGERWHLGSEESFTRAFRAAYGITPRMARTVALTTHESGGTSATSSQLTRWMRNMAPPGPKGRWTR